jgi:hypothetical protein
MQLGPCVDHVAPGDLVPLGQRGEAGRHRLQRRVGLRIGLVEDQERATRLQRPGHRGERRRLCLRSDLVYDQEASGDVVLLVLLELVDPLQPSLAAVRQPSFGDQLAGELD